MGRLSVERMDSTVFGEAQLEIIDIIKAILHRALQIAAIEREGT